MRVIRLVLWGWGIGLAMGSVLIAVTSSAFGATMPDGIQPGLELVAGDWLQKIPPTGAVNAPEFLTSVYPGQKITLVVVAAGPDREKRLKDTLLSVQFSVSGAPETSETNLRPQLIRGIKAEGADLAIAALKAGGFASDSEAAIEKTSLIFSYGFFQPEWKVPLGVHAGELVITVKALKADPLVVFAPLRIKVKDVADWLSDPVPTQKDLGLYLNRYHDDIPPGRILFWLKATAQSGDFNVPNLAGFFAHVYKENVRARDVAVALFPSLEAKTQRALLISFRLAAISLKETFPAIPSENLTAFNAIAPLGDVSQLPHYRDPVDSDAVRKIGAKMDQCWSAWMATGDQRYLRALVGLLEGAPDYPAYQAWFQAKGGRAGLNAQVSRGLAYQIAGWSIGAFQYADPLVADWLSYWAKDENVSPLIRSEITGLSSNPAFRKK